MLNKVLFILFFSIPAFPQVYSTCHAENSCHEVSCINLIQMKCYLSRVIFELNNFELKNHESTEELLEIRKNLHYCICLMNEIIDED